MRSVFLFGGFAGFILCVIAGAIAGREPELILRDAAIGCIAGAFLFRWFWSVLIGTISETLAAKRATAEAAAEAAAAAQQKTK